MSVLLCIVLHGTQIMAMESCQQRFGCLNDEEDCPCTRFIEDCGDGLFSIPNYPKSTKGAERIYEKKTLEIGVVVSPGFYEVVKKQLGQNIGEEMIEKMIEDSVREMFAKAQPFLLLDSISKTGGFTLLLNGIKILKNYEPLEGLTDDEELLRKFLKYAEVSNPSWDGDEASHDLMVLLNGYEAGYGYEAASGAANTDTVCKSDAVAVLTVSMQNGKPGMLFGPKTLAHEIGHVLGASHDGAVINNHCTAFEVGEPSPCRSADYIMSSYKDPSMWWRQTTWSTCSQRDIDNGEHERKDCYYT